MDYRGGIHYLVELVYGLPGWHTLPGIVGWRDDGLPGWYNDGRPSDRRPNAIVSLISVSV